MVPIEPPRYAAALTQRGYSVDGIDSSPGMSPKPDDQAVQGRAPPVNLTAPVRNGPAHRPTRWETLPRCPAAATMPFFAAASSTISSMTAIVRLFSSPLAGLFDLRES